MERHYPVVVIGGGHSGLSVSYHLGRAGIEHLVLEKDCVASSWRKKRWDSFCLVTPNWQCLLPDHPYRGADPDGFMVKDEIVDYVLSFVASFEPPVLEGVEVQEVRPVAGGFVVETSAGTTRADQVVVATGAYHFPARPAFAARVSGSVTQLHSEEYRNADALPEGGVLVVGSGQSGCQIMEDLHLAGRKVHLSLGSAPRSPRFYRGKDAVRWLDQMGYYETSVETYPDVDAVRAKTNHYLTGRDGGREIDLRRFALDGVELYGSLRDMDGDTLSFEDNVVECLDAADTVYCGIRRLIDEFIEKHSIDAPREAPYVPVWTPEAPPSSISLRNADIKTIIWATGYRYDFRWIHAPVFDERGYPRYRRGVTDVQGLYFIGLPWLHTWGSGRFSGVARDVEHLMKHIVAIDSRKAASVANGETERPVVGA